MTRIARQFGRALVAAARPGQHHSHLLRCLPAGTPPIVRRRAPSPLTASADFSTRDNPASPLPVLVLVALVLAALGAAAYFLGAGKK
jgi:hypothetical protein